MPSTLADGRLGLWRRCHIQRYSCNYDTEKEVGDEEGKDHRSERGLARWTNVIGGWRLATDGLVSGFCINF